jgi:hypothetical protein
VFTIRAKLLGLVFFLLGLGFFVPPASAQDCVGVVIDDSQSSADLNQAALCESASAWVARGFQVYIFLTDYAPPNEDTWFSTLDQFEISQGIRNSSGFLQTAIAFEASTMRNNTFAANITMPDTLNVTPLWQDATLQMMKGQFRNLLNTGDYNRAFSETISSSYQTAFPPPTLTPRPSNTPLPTATTNPVVATQQAAAAQAERAAQEAQQQQTMATVTSIFVVIVVVIASGLIIVFVGIPTYKKWRVVQNYRTQSTKLMNRSANLITAIETLLEGPTLEETTLYELWDAYGGKKYADRNKQVEGWLTAARQAFAKVSETFTALKREETSHSPEEWTQKWEILYLTIVGTTARILNMNQAEQEELLNPLTGLKQEVIGDELFQQIDDVFQSLQGDETLNIQLMVMSAETVESAGILGYVALVKESLVELQTAKDKATPTISRLQQDISDFNESFKFSPEILNNEDGLKFARDQLTLAQQAMTEGRWLDAFNIADTAMKFVEHLSPTLKAYIEAVQQSEQRITTISELETAGFKLQDLQQPISETRNNYKGFKTTIGQGNLVKAEEHIREISARSRNALQEAQKRSQQHERNNKRLVELAQSVAQIQTFADQEVGTAWEALQAYPSSNWVGLDEILKTARQSIQQLFDNPTNADDLSSGIQRQNALEGSQDFSGASEALDKAFAQLQESKLQLQSILDRLNVVREIEEQVETSIDAAKQDLKKAFERRDSDNTKVNTIVDQMLADASEKIRVAEQAIIDREFTNAANMIKDARQFANKAYEDASAQIAAINEAIRTLNEQHRRSVQTIEQSVSEFSNLPAVVRSETIAQLIANAKQALQQADIAAQHISGQQDDKWLSALNEVTSFFAEAEQRANQAMNSIDQARREYQQRYDAAQQALSEANAAINRAQNSVRDSDANNAGDSALRRARSSMMEMAEFGVGYDILNQILEAARLAQRTASQAQHEAESEIAAVRRRRREEEEERQRRRREQEDRDRRSAADRARRSSSSSFGSSSRSSSFGSSSRSSSFGGSKR